ncbi:MAG: YdeI/OmpD-associated family protein [Thermomicrobiales bacterium]
MAKKASGIASVTHPEALDIALCFGWIDGQRRAFDDDYFLQKFTAPPPQQVVEDQPGQGPAADRGWQDAAIRHGPDQAARADGRWQDAYASQSRMTVPEDLQVRLDEQPDASRFFDSLDSRNRYAILYRIQDAKRAETRVRRIEQFMEMLMNGEKIY